MKKRLLVIPIAAVALAGVAIHNQQGPNVEVYRARQTYLQSRAEWRAANDDSHIHNRDAAPSTYRYLMAQHNYEEVCRRYGVEFKP